MYTIPDAFSPCMYHTGVLCRISPFYLGMENMKSPAAVFFASIAHDLLLRAGAAMTSVCPATLLYSPYCSAIEFCSKPMNKE